MSGAGGRKLGVALGYVAVIAALAAFGWYWYQEQRAPAAQNDPVPPPVAVRRPEPRLLSNEVRFNGYIEAEDTVAVRPKVSGTLERIDVAVGDEVSKGDVVAQIERDEYEPQVNRARARLDAARSSYERAQRLREAGSITEQELEEARSTFESARAAHELASIQLERTSLEAPVAGTVLRRNAVAGELVGPEVPIVTIATVNRLSVTINMPEEYYGTIARRRFRRIEIEVPAAGGNRIAGAVETVAPYVSSQSKSFETKVRLTANPEGVAPGMFARVHVVLDETRRDAVPIGALVGGESLWYVDEEGLAQRLRLEEPLTASDYVAVPPEHSQTRFIVEGQHFLDAGQEVRIVEDEGTQA